MEKIDKKDKYYFSELSNMAKNRAIKDQIEFNKKQDAEEIAIQMLIDNEDIHKYTIDGELI